LKRHPGEGRDPSKLLSLRYRSVWTDARLRAHDDKKKISMAALDPAIQNRSAVSQPVALDGRLGGRP
jgi:hypothetical protein